MQNTIITLNRHNIKLSVFIMKNLVLLLIIIATGNYVAAQETILTGFQTELKRANTFYNDRYYDKALDLYLSTHKLDPRDDIKLKIADCYLKLNQSEEASFWYEKLIENDFNLSSRDILKYVLALTGKSDYQKAQIWYEKYKQLQSDSISANISPNKKDLADLLSDSILYDVREAEINSTYSDFSPFFYEQGIAFISARQTSLFIQNNVSQSENGYLDLYYAPFEDLSTKGGIPVLDKAKAVKGKFTSQIHKGPAVTYNNGNSMLITLNSPSEDSNKDRKLYLYSTQKKGKKWKAPTPLPFNNAEYSCGHPAISADGKTLYFISDMPGGFGGTDIYTSTFNKNKWSKPVNLGSKINTAGNEMFPFIHNDTTLYFSSNGHIGLGGLDIVKIALTDSSATVKNVGYPINTQKDDFSLVLNENGSIGFFSSNRKSKGSDDNIYKVLINVGKPGPLYVKNITGTIKLFKSQYQQENGELLEDVEVRVIDFETSDPIAEGKTDVEGNFNIDIPIAGKFYLMCYKKGAGTYQTVFNIPEKTTFKDNFSIVLFKEDLFQTEE